MADIIREQIGDNPVLVTLLILILFGYFCYREYPELMRRIKGKAVSDLTNDTIVARLDVIEKKVDDLTSKSARDYVRLNNIEESLRQHDVGMSESLRERQLLMTGILACLKGLKEQGCNGPVSEAIMSIEAYLIEESHRGKEQEWK